VTTPHTGRAHARLAPSASHRWIECPGSVAASEMIADESSVYAAEGTAAHELAAHCLLGGHDSVKYLGFCVDTRSTDGSIFTTKKPDSVTVFEVDEEMVESVQLYLDTVRSLLPKKSDDYELDVEQRLDMTHLHPEIYGTGDTVIYLPRSATLHVLDFKYGKGVAVEVDENPQLMLYGAGAAKRYHNRRVDKVALHIVQPRAQHHRGPVRSWVTDALTLMEFEDDIRVAAVRAMDPDAPRFAGEWCRFCKALPVCPVARQKARAVAQSQFDDESSDTDVSGAGESPRGGTSVSPATLSPDALAKVLREAEFVGNWVKAVQEHAHAEAIAGRMPTGFKLVPKRATRKWKGDQEEVRDWLVVEGLDDEDIFVEPTLRSPAQIEKVMGKKAFADIADSMVVKVSSGTNLVPETDHRKGVKSSADSDFDVEM
jgi:hypothetical protein